ncbi:MAG: hypothetical protein Sapg2KO_30680 [Saprospiraceae bacterium]
MKAISFLNLCLLFFASLSVNAQQTGKVDYKVLGINFTIPNGWVGQEGEGMFVMGSNTIPGVILMTTNEATTMEQMKQEARVGIVDQAGTNLQLSGDFDAVGTNGIGAEFLGTLEFQAAKAYVIGLLNPFGQGVTIMAVTLKDKYTNDHKSAAITLAKSLQFKKPAYGPIAEQWKKDLNGVRLTYMSSYSSVDYSNPNYTSGGGYSTKKVIDLCPQGYFTYNGSHSMNIDASGSTASSNGTGKGAGTWKVIANTSGQAVLQLNYYDGAVSEYVLTTEDGKTMLDGTRYFRTWTGENAPDCN